jgi:spermidine synthase
VGVIPWFDAPVCRMWVASYAMNTISTANTKNSTTQSLSIMQVRPIILLLFFISGISALVYEVVWVRMLSLSFGVSVYAVSAVLSAFMGGLAFGAWLFGRIAPMAAKDNIDSVGTPYMASLRLYALLQLGVAVAALASPWIMAAITNLYAALDQTGSIAAGFSNAIRFGLAILVLIIPTTLMGGTLPIMAQLLAHDEQRRGATLGALYAANTFGAVLGTLLAGFILIRFLGTSASLMVAAAGDLVTVAVAWWITQVGIKDQETRRPEDQEAKRPAGKKTQKPGNRKSASQKHVHSNISISTSPQLPVSHPFQYAPIVTLIGFSLSGFVSLAYQVVWMRTLAIFSLSAVFSFSVMLATFLMGLAIGGAVMSRQIDRFKKPLLVFSILQLAIGISTILGQYIFAKLPTIIEALTLPTDLLSVVWAELLPALVTMLLPTLLIGATFPVAARIYADLDDHVGERIGRLYAGNTLGAMLGSLVAGFVLIPTLGLQNSILCLATLNLLIGCMALVGSRPLSRRIWVGFGSAIAGAILAAAFLPPGVFLGFREGVTPQLKFYQEGVDATVAVFQVDDPPLKISFVNGRNEVPTDPQSMRAFYMLGHLPALLRPEAQNALVVSFGNGIATGSLAQHPIKQITAVELVSGQVEAARKLYTTENRDVLNDPRLQIVHEDGRNFLLRDTAQYQIITADATHPINSSSWALFTQEFYRLVQAHMAPDGVFIQWLPFHDLRAKDYYDIVHTFQSVFPNTTVFYTGGIHTFLVATPEPLTRAQLLALEDQMQYYSAGKDLGSAAQLADDMLLDAQGVSAYTTGARIISDDRAFFLPGKEESQILQSFAPYALR